MYCQGIALALPRCPWFGENHLFFSSPTIVFLLFGFVDLIMAKQSGNILITGTIDNLCFTRWTGSTMSG